MTLINLDGQTFSSRSGSVFFYSDAPMEKIEAHNNQVITKLDARTGSLDFAILIKAFQFEKQLMYKHFNEDYMESHKYPKANFQGQIQNLANVDFNTPGIYTVSVTGTLNLHGVTKKITEKGTLRINGNQINASSKFSINVDDFNISIPVILKDKISKTILLEIKTKLNPG